MVTGVLITGKGYKWRNRCMARLTVKYAILIIPLNATGDPILGIIHLRCFLNFVFFFYMTQSHLK